MSQPHSPTGRQSTAGGFRWNWIAVPLLLAWPSANRGVAADAEPGTVEFQRDILPILQQSCIECHGPQKAEGGLRLDERAAALAGGDSGPVLRPGLPDDSELLWRVSLPPGDPEIMPAIGDPLSPRQIDLLQRWIDQGAEWPDSDESPAHWAYRPPIQVAPPEVATPAWPINAIDRFVLARLEQQGLSPSPAADRALLIRRLSLDLIGLPPAPRDVDAFVLDESPDAYERLVDRLLATNQFGVRWARPWLDYARYADSHGFQRDDLRDLWAYRDWVVDALNADMPFDQFTIEQLAGDLLPNPAADQLIATGFNRNAPTNVEAGSEPEETRVNQVFDRVNTLGMVWLGTTLECCQCHDHKYDPFTMRDYYGLFAFFNNTQIEADRSNPDVPGSIRFLGPEMPLADPAVEQTRTALQKQIDDVAHQLAARRADIAQPDPHWEAELLARLEDVPEEHLLQVISFESLGGATHEVLEDGSVLLSGEAPDRDTYTVTVRTDLTGIRAIKLETLTHPSLPGDGPGRGAADRPNFVLHNFALEAAAVSGGEPQPVSFTGAEADFSQQNYDVAGAVDEDPKTAWAINPQFHEPHWAVFRTVEPLGFPAGSELTFRLEQNYGGARTIGRLRLSAITGEYGAAAIPAAVADALRTPSHERTDEQHAALVEHRLKHDAEYVRLEKEQTRLQTELKKLQPPTTLVMRELPEVRPSFIMQRGDYKSPGDAVLPATPASLHAGPLSTDSAPLTRLDLARWLVDPSNPLAARVAVNRWWAELFGRGIVATPEDFGLKGERPTHPELLDWLAVEFVDSGWSMKHTLKTIVMSATYRQSSRVTPDLLARDDRNQLYARGPRLRLEAELIRDNALAIAGLLSLKQGGPPIRPYQPDGVWIKVGGERYDYEVSPGEDQYRRGLYVVWKRGAPYPSFINFDANSRLACRVQRPRSNTPLQALTLMNDPVYVAAAFAFASRVITESQPPDLDSRLTYAFRLALSRSPQPDELATLRELYNAQHADALADPKAAGRLIGAHALPDGTTGAELAAWYSVCTALLNLDETITRN